MKLILRTNKNHDNYTIKTNNGSKISFNLSHNRILYVIDVMLLMPKLFKFMYKPVLVWGDRDVDYIEVDGVDVTSKELL